LLRRHRLPARLPGRGPLLAARQRRVRRRPSHQALGAGGTGGLRAGSGRRNPDGLALVGLRRRRLAGCRRRAGRANARQHQRSLWPRRSSRRSILSAERTGAAAAWRLCARHELTLAVRSRWTQIFAVVFAALSLAVAGSGYVLSGGSGVQDFARTSASLVQLVLLLVPLTPLLVGVTAPAGGA